jgi:hypothetical protein
MYCYEKIKEESHMTLHYGLRPFDFYAQHIYGRISSPQEIEQALVFAIRLSLMIKIKKD